MAFNYSDYSGFDNPANPYYQNGNGGVQYPGLSSPVGGPGGNITNNGMPQYPGEPMNPGTPPGQINYTPGQANPGATIGPQGVPLSQGTGTFGQPGQLAPSLEGNSSNVQGGVNAFTPTPGAPDAGIQLDPSRSMDDSYITYIGQLAAKAVGGQFDPNAFSSYWLPKIKNGGGINQYWLGRLLAPDTASAGGAGGAGAANPLGAGNGGAYVPGAGVPGMGTVFGAGGNTGNVTGNALVDYLVGRGTGKISDSSLPALNVDPNDPIIKNQVDAYRTQQTNALNNYETQLAETAGPNSNINAQKLSAAETMGQNVGGFEAQLIAQELNNRRTEIQNALSGAYGFLSQEQQMQLQEEMAQLQLEEQQYGTTASLNLQAQGL